MITHSRNCIILTSTFPSIPKLTKIIPTYKSGKPLYDIESFRPLNNLCPIEQIIEEYIKIHLDKHLDQNNIINKCHHGGGKDHSTTTALTSILNTIYTKYEQDNVVCVLITDLSKAYDTCDQRYYYLNWNIMV